MRNTIFTLFIAMLINIQTYGNEFISNSKELGIVSYLTTIKAMAEHKMISLASDNEYLKQTGKAAEFRTHYNMLKLSIDKLINQLSADMIDKNSVKKYRSINKYVKGDLKDLPKDLLVYKKLIDNIDGQMESFLLRTYSSMLAGPELSDIIGGIELVHTAITDARDFREKKVQSIIGVLEKLKLEKIKDLTEKKEKE